MDFMRFAIIEFYEFIVEYSFFLLRNNITETCNQDWISWIDERRM